MAVCNILIFLSDLDENLHNSAILILKYVDNSKILAGVTSLDNVERTQVSLDGIYNWVETNNMSYNGDKFECLKIGANEDLK